MRAAGCPTRIADPLWKASPSATLPRSIPNGNFPKGMSFRLGTPERVNIGVRVNEFKPPETESWWIASKANSQNFSRGHRFFDHWNDQQQRAHLLVPMFPQQSRVSDLNRVWNRQRHHEARRDATLTLIDYNESRRLDRLRRTKSLLQCPDTAHHIEKVIQRSCSEPALTQPSVCQAPVLKLLNRRVDVNRMKHSRNQMTATMARECRQKNQDCAKQMSELFSAISGFEANHIPEDQLNAMRTTAEWTSSLPHRNRKLTPHLEANEDEEDGTLSLERTTRCVPSRVHFAAP